MAYEPTNWKTGDVITAERLNKLEDGVASGGSSDVMLAETMAALVATQAGEVIMLSPSHDGTIDMTNLEEHGAWNTVYVCDKPVKQIILRVNEGRLLFRPSSDFEGMYYEGKLIETVRRDEQPASTDDAPVSEILTPGDGRLYCCKPPVTDDGSINPTVLMRLTPDVQSN